MLNQVFTIGKESQDIDSKGHINTLKLVAPGGFWGFQEQVKTIKLILQHGDL